MLQNIFIILPENFFFVYYPLSFAHRSYYSSNYANILYTLISNLEIQTPS